MRRLFATLGAVALVVAVAVSPAEAGSAPIYTPAGKLVQVGAPLAGGPVAPRAMAKPGVSSAKVLSTWYGYASKYQYVTGGADGATVKLQVSNPFVGAAGHSIAELACSSDDGANRVEIGWRKGYGDSGPYVFTYSWIGGVPQGYGVGFTPVVGAAHANGTYLTATTSTNRVLWNIGCQYFGGKWWLGWDSTPGNFEWIGYYNGTLWSGASPAQTFVKGGLFEPFGEVASLGGSAPTTDMGNGYFGYNSLSFPAAPNIAATYYSNYALINPPTGVTASLTKDDPDTSLYRSSSGGTSAYFGGPGAGGNVGS